MSGTDLTPVLLQAALTLTTRFVGYKLTELSASGNITETMLNKQTKPLDHFF